MTNPETNSTSENLAPTSEETERSDERTSQERAADILRLAPEPADKRSYVYNRLSSSWDQVSQAVKYLEGKTDIPEDDATLQYVEKLRDVDLEEFDLDDYMDNVKDEIMAGYAEFLENWTNPTGLLQESIALYSGGSSPNTCSHENCGHQYQGNSMGTLYADDGKGFPIEEIEGVRFNDNTLHVLEDHPNTEDAIKNAREIIALQSSAEAYRQE
jgi:hypothetical protein